MNDVYIIGAGGHGIVVAEIAELLGYQVVGFIDDNPALTGNLILGMRVLGGSETLPAGAQVALGIGDNAARTNLLRAAEIHDWRLPVLIHPSAVVSRSAVLGAGTVVVAQAVVNPRAVIGSGCILNTASSTDHDCILGEAVHLAPGVRLAGGVTVGAGTLIGVGSCTKPCITIGAWTTVGVGSVLVADIPDGVIAYGNPARVCNR